MKIKLVTVGKLKEKYLKDGIAEYAKRLKHFTKFELIELSDEKTPDKSKSLRKSANSGERRESYFIENN